jgi:hypothetical protein
MTLVYTAYPALLRALSAPKVRSVRNDVLSCQQPMRFKVEGTGCVCIRPNTCGLKIDEKSPVVLLHLLRRKAKAAAFSWRLPLQDSPVEVRGPLCISKGRPRSSAGCKNMGTVGP